MFRFLVEDAKKFRSAVDAIVNLIDEGPLEVGPGGLTLRAMDPSQIAMVSFAMPKTSFVEYDAPNPVRVGLNFDNLSKFLSRARAGEKLEISHDENKVTLRFSAGKRKRSFKIPVLEMTGGANREPNVQPESYVKMTGGTVKETLRDASLVSTHICIEMSESQIRFYGKGDSADFDIDHEAGSEELIELKAGATASKATFPLQYLEDIVKACPDAAPITINLKSNAPVKIEYEVEGAKMVYFLAPRIETD